MPIEDEETEISSLLTSLPATSSTASGRFEHSEVDVRRLKADRQSLAVDDESVIRKTPHAGRHAIGPSSPVTNEAALRTLPDDDKTLDHVMADGLQLLNEL